jgi:Tn3 transposase DDE domain
MPRGYLSYVELRLLEQFDIVSKKIAANELPGVTIENKKLVVSPIISDNSNGATQFRDRIYNLLPRIKLTDLLVEVDSWTGFTKYFTHLQTGELASDKIILLSTILADAINLGFVTASLMMRKLASYPRQNKLALALREAGKIERTLFTLYWLQSPQLRRKATSELNKGELKNSLARAVCFHRLGEIRDRSFEDQSLRASGLNLAIAAIVLWNTVYLENAVNWLKSQGVIIPDDYLQHLSPMGWEHINLTGDYVWNLKSESSLDNLRPLRTKKYNF